MWWFCMFVISLIFLVCIALAFGVHAVRRAISKGVVARGADVKRCLVVLGSGGHTAEMIYDLKTFQKVYNQIEFVYLAADTDHGSSAHVEAFHKDHSLPTNPLIVRVPRAREVGQSYASSVFSILRASSASLFAVAELLPDAVLTNGPGTCVPVVLAACLINWWGLWRMVTIYSESFACVEHLSVSGRILHRLVDCFFVKWPQLLGSVPNAVHAGIKSSPESATRLRAPAIPSENNDEFSSTAIVTVGSTKFERLIDAIDTPSFLHIIQGFGITRVRIQIGSSARRPRRLESEVHTVGVEVFDYSPELPRDLSRASLVISHAGAGTLLDCLRAGRRVVAVPNEDLMANHQVQLGNALQDLNFLLCFKVGELLQGLRTADFQDLSSFPAEPSNVYCERILQHLDFKHPRPKGHLMQT